MKLVNFGPIGEEKPGLIDKEGRIRSLEGICSIISADLLASNAFEKLKTVDINTLPEVESTIRLGAPLLKPGKIIAVGLNYDEHIKETNSKKQDEPVLFTKAVSALNGPFDPIELPKNSKKVDWEIELVIIIGKHAKYIDRSEALSHIAGFCTGIDVSERHFQKNRSGQWLKGKSADTFAPIGPYFVTRDEFTEFQSADLYLDVNGERMQSSNTHKMIHDVCTLVSYINEFMSLHPGDLIFTGTPAGVGMGFNPPRFLQLGDKVSGEVLGLGCQHHDVINFSSP